MSKSGLSRKHCRRSPVPIRITILCVAALLLGCGRAIELERNWYPRKIVAPEVFGLVYRFLEDKRRLPSSAELRLLMERHAVSEKQMELKLDPKWEYHAVLETPHADSG